MAVPFRVIGPAAALEPAGFLGARADRQDGIAIGDEPRAEARHEGCVSHQNGTSGAMASSRLRVQHGGGRRRAWGGERGAFEEELNSSEKSSMFLTRKGLRGPLR